jgi:hypothetical protein
MRRFLIGLLVVLVVLAVGAGALGYSRGWFTVSTSDKDKTIPIDVTVDREKVKEDAERAKAKVKEVTGQDKGKAGEPGTNKAKKDGAPKGAGGE